MTGFQYIKGAYKVRERVPFLWACNDKKWEYSFKLKKEVFRLDMRKTLSIQRRVKYWKRLSREVVDVLKMFKTMWP